MQPGETFNARTATRDVALDADGIELAREVLSTFAAPGEVVDVAAELTALFANAQPGATTMTHDQIWLLYRAMRGVSYLPPRWDAARRILDELRAHGESFYK